MEALETQRALARLMELDLPIKASLDTAIISNMVDVQAKAYSTVLSNLYKKYSVKAQAGETEGTIQFICTIEGDNEEATNKLKTENLQAFMEKFSELLEAKTEDLSFKKIRLPEDITIKPEILKALVEFVEIG